MDSNKKKLGYSVCKVSLDTYDSVHRTNARGRNVHIIISFNVDVNVVSYCCRGFAETGLGEC